jgi:hypothetical protein
MLPSIYLPKFMKATMRAPLVFAAIALLAGNAFADEAAACYVSKDTTGDLVPGRMQPFNANAETAAQISHLLNESNREVARCFDHHLQRERAWPNNARIMFGMRVAPTGEVTQVSVVASRNINDGLLMACVGRAVCKWKIKASADGTERLLALPPYGFGKRFWSDLKPTGAY